MEEKEVVKKVNKKVSEVSKKENKTTVADSKKKVGAKSSSAQKVNSALKEGTKTATTVKKSVGEKVNSSAKTTNKTTEKNTKSEVKQTSNNKKEVNTSKSKANAQAKVSLSKANNTNSENKTATHKSKNQAGAKQNEAVQIKSNSKSATTKKNNQLNKNEDTKKINRSTPQLKVKTKKDIEKESKQPEGEYEKDINIKTIDEEIEHKLDLDVIDEEFKRKHSLLAADFVEILKKSVINIIPAVIFLAFLVINIVCFHKMPKEGFIKLLHCSSFAFLAAAIVLFELSYRKEEMPKCVTGIEMLFMGILTLVLPYIYQIFHGTFLNLITSSMIIVVGYFLIKFCVVFYRNQNKFIRGRENITVEEEDNEFNIDDND